MGSIGVTGCCSIGQVPDPARGTYLKTADGPRPRESYLAAPEEWTMAITVRTEVVWPLRRRRGSLPIPTQQLGYDVTEPITAEPGAVGRRPAPAGLPDARIQPPTIAESGDPFGALRVIDLVATMDRGRAVRIDDLVDRLNATHLDWLFTRAVVVDGLVALQANWMADYRNSSGIVIEDGPYGSTVTLEDSSRVDPWIVRQAQREASECRRRLDEFARRDRPFAGG
jgi:hypothetical protein